MADHLGACLAVAALTMALAARRPPSGSLVRHSDRGVQYACAEYTDVLEAHRIAASMSRVGNPYDNAIPAQSTPVNLSSFSCLTHGVQFNPLAVIFRDYQQYQRPAFFRSEGAAISCRRDPLRRNSRGWAA